MSSRFSVCFLNTTETSKEFLSSGHWTATVPKLNVHFATKTRHRDTTTPTAAK